MAPLTSLCLGLLAVGLCVLPTLGATATITGRVEAPRSDRVDFRYQAPLTGESVNRSAPSTARAALPWSWSWHTPSWSPAATAVGVPRIGAPSWENCVWPWGDAPCCGRSRCSSSPAIPCTWR